MHTHYIKHVPYEDLGSIAPSFKAAGCTVSSTEVYEDPTFPDARALDLLVVMGGPMSVNDEAQHAWLAPEKAFIRDAITAGKSVLGVCLGAQLIASALGARVYPSTVAEIGWFPVRASLPGGSATFRFPPSLEVFHWHSETFDLPEGATRLAESPGCRNQAFQLGRSVIGLQFHLEATPETAHTFVANSGATLTPSRYVQSAHTILAAEPTKYRVINSLMDDILTYLNVTGE